MVVAAVVNVTSDVVAVIFAGVDAAAPVVALIAGIAEHCVLWLLKGCRFLLSARSFETSISKFLRLAS